VVLGLSDRYNLLIAKGYFETFSFLDFLKGSQICGCTMVTGNTRHFERMPGIVLDNWHVD